MTLSQLWRSKQLEYTWLRSLMGRYQDFEAVTLAALRFACGSLNLALTSEHRAALMDEYLHLTPYPEVPETLSALAGRKLGILSNGSPSMLERLLRNTGLTEYFNFILSVDAIGIYKPHPSVYQFAVDNLGVKATDISFVSSNYWDAAGAAAFGFRVFWIKRTETMPDELGVQPYGVLSSLAELPALLV